MVNEVELSVCDVCEIYALVGKKCPECKGEMREIVFVRKASQLTPVALDAGDSPAPQSDSQPEELSAALAGTKPALRK